MEGWWAASYIVLWMVVLALVVVVVALARQIGTLHLRVEPQGALEIDGEGPMLGEAPPAFETVTADGRAAVVGGPGEAQLLLFASPGCNVCEQVLPGLRATSATLGARPYIISDLDRDDAPRAFGSKLPAPLVPAPEIVRAYDVPGTPFVVVLDELGVVRSKGTPNNLEQMEGLVHTARRRIREAASERQAS